MPHTQTYQENVTSNYGIQINTEFDTINRFPFRCFLIFIKSLKKSEI